VDLGDRHSHVCVLDEHGALQEQSRIKTTRIALERRFERAPRARIVVEAGTHTGWVGELLAKLGHEVVVANPRKVRAIYESTRKDDQHDAEMLARLGRADVKLLHPIELRSAQVRQDRALLRSRAALVDARTMLVNHVRGVAKSLGRPLKPCSTESFHKQELATDLREGLGGVMEEIAALTERIKTLDKRVTGLCRECYPQTELLRQPKGVGPVTALWYMLTIEDPKRFQRSRDVGSYVGLVPRRSQSGERDPELRISKAGDRMLRALLVQCAHYMLGPFGEDSDLRRYGLRLASTGKKRAKRRAVVAVARKLAVLLHRLWSSGEVYEPLRNAARAAQVAQRRGGAQHSPEVAAH
jgi:transposase